MYFFRCGNLGETEFTDFLVAFISKHNGVKLLWSALSSRGDGIKTLGAFKNFVHSIYPLEAY